MYSLRSPPQSSLRSLYKQQQQEQEQQQAKFLNFDPRFQCWHYILDTLTHFK